MADSKDKKKKAKSRSRSSSARRSRSKSVKKEKKKEKKHSKSPPVKKETKKKESKKDKKRSKSPPKKEEKKEKAVKKEKREKSPVSDTNGKSNGSEEGVKSKENEKEKEGKSKVKKETKKKRSRSGSAKKSKKSGSRSGSRSKSSSRSPSRKRTKKKRSESRSRSRRKSKSGSRSRSRRSRSKSRKHSRSKSRKRRSRSRRRSHSRSRRRSRSRKRSRSRRRSKSRRKSRSRSRSRSRRRRSSRSKSRKHSRKRSHSKSRSKSRDTKKEKDKVKGETKEENGVKHEQKEITPEEKAAQLEKELAATELLMAERRERVRLEQAKKAKEGKHAQLVDESNIPAEFRKDHREEEEDKPLPPAEMGDFKSPEEVKLILELEKKLREESEAVKKAREVKVEQKPTLAKPNAGFSEASVTGGTSILGGRKIEIKVKKRLGGFNFESAAELSAQKEKERKERLAKEEAEHQREEAAKMPPPPPPTPISSPSLAPPPPPPEEERQKLLEEERRARLAETNTQWHDAIKEANARGEQRKKLKAEAAARRKANPEDGDAEDESEGEDATRARKEVDEKKRLADLEDAMEEPPEEVSSEPFRPEEGDTLEEYMAPVNNVASTEIAESIEKATPNQAMYGVPGTVAPGVEEEQQYEESEAKPVSEAGERFYMNEEKYSDDDLDEEEKEDWLAKQQLKGKGKELKPVNHAKIKYIEFRKKFYIESPEISSMTEEEVKEYREKELEGVAIRGKGCPRPIKKWIHCGLSTKVYKELEKLGMTTPFPIQAQAIPAIMSGRDVIACAKTGSGKTLAFVLPMLRHIMDQPELGATDGPIGLIMCPTRELAVQIHQDISKFAKKLELRPVAIYGGAGIAAQISALKAGAEIITCTPGRMIDMLCANNGRVTNLTRCTYCVLDEADRMFDMGFAPQIMAIIENMRPDRQTVMFSATFPRSVELLAKKALNAPIEIIIGGRSTASGDVKQLVEVRAEDTKFRRLLELLGKWYAGGDNILIFVDKQEHVDHLYRQLHDSGYPGLALHGGMDQADRDFTLADFKSKLRTILVSTSLCARGLDVKDLVLVVNYTAPNHYEDYVHRVGRTGRAGKKGTAITFITPEEERFAPDLVKALTASKQTVPLDLQKMADAYGEKRHTGAVQWGSNDGYKTKGFHFDANEDVAKKTEALALKAGYVEDDVAAQAAAETVQEQQMVLAEKKAAALEEKKELDPIKAQLQKGKAVASAVRMAISQSVTTTGQVSLTAAANAQAAAKEALGPDGNEAIRSQGNAAARAFAIAMSIKAELGKKNGLGITSDGGHSYELEINDYPQHSRFKATHKKTIDMVCDMTDTTITTKGMWVPPGRNALHGERKLYLYIEGKTEVAVKLAKQELLRILEEAAMDAKPEKDAYSKYAVLV